MTNFSYGSLLELSDQVKAGIMLALLFAPLLCALRKSAYLKISAVVFAAAPLAVALLELTTHAIAERNLWYCLDHYLCMLWFSSVACIFEGSWNEKSEAIEKRSAVPYWTIVALCFAWSCYNEIIVYLLQNPDHGIDLHHWSADLAGFLTMGAVRYFNYLTRPLPTASLVAG